MELVQFLLRWVHLLAGVTWIGLLYYFNFVQTPFFAETEAGTRTGAIQKLVPRALWWFRWGAMYTFLAGLLIWLIKLSQLGGDFFPSGYGMAITVGATMGTIMFLNVWLVIWPNQQVVIAPLPTRWLKGASRFRGRRARVSGLGSPPVPTCCSLPPWFS